MGLISIVDFIALVAAFGLGKARLPDLLILAYRFLGKLC